MKKILCSILLAQLFLLLTNFEIITDVKVGTLTYSMTNIHVIQSNGKVFLIDAGYAKNANNIIKGLSKMGIDIKDVDGIIVSHGHSDHAGSAKFFQETYQIPIIAGKGDVLMLKAGKNAPFKTTSQYARFIEKFIKHTFPPVTPDIQIEKEYDLNELGINGKIIPMSGHTKGSLVILIDDMAFVGDMMRSATFNKKSPKTHLFHENIELAQKNIETILKNKNIATFYIGHGGPLSRKRVVEYFQK
ncbi:MAG: MBL fold metallo-hydrolase [Saprospiraceae bacterium]